MKTVQCITDDLELVDENGSISLWHWDEDSGTSITQLSLDEVKDLYQALADILDERVPMFKRFKVEEGEIVPISEPAEELWRITNQLEELNFHVKEMRHQAVMADSDLRAAREEKAAILAFMESEAVKWSEGDPCEGRAHLYASVIRAMRRQIDCGEHMGKGIDDED